jgi:hypothetical protein
MKYISVGIAIAAAFAAIYYSEKKNIYEETFWAFISLINYISYHADRIIEKINK